MDFLPVQEEVSALHPEFPETKARFVPVDFLAVLRKYSDEKIQIWIFRTPQFRIVPACFEFLKGNFFASINIFVAKGK